jgi:long-chain acyl-CoA synthetase
LVKSTSILVVGDPERQQQNFSERAAKAGIAVRWWEEIWEEGEVADDIVDETCEYLARSATDRAVYSDTHSYFYAEDGSVVKTTHLNMTAGIAGLLSLFPADKRPTSADVIGSSVRLDTPFGMTIALAAVFTGELIVGAEVLTLRCRLPLHRPRCARLGPA